MGVEEREQAHRLALPAQATATIAWARLPPADQPSRW